MAEADLQGRHGDRKLGDEWNDWEGDRDPADKDIDERPDLFVSLSSAVLALFFSIVAIGWFLVEPRFEQLAPSLAQTGGWVLAGGILAAVVLILSEGALLLTRGRSFLPYAWIERLMLSLLPRAIWLGARFRISKDRVGNSFLKMHNLVTRNALGRQGPGRLLVLLPRCLKKEARAALTQRLSGGEFKVYTAAGGEEARKAIREYRPKKILAIACERDLMSGIKDVADRIPVIAVPNKRPEGPCKNTEFNVAQLEEALAVLQTGTERS